MRQHRQYDILLFGATGFAGRLTAKHLYRRCRDEGLRFGLAGRNRERLEPLSRELAAGAAELAAAPAREPVSPETPAAPAIEIASADDPDSLRRLAAKTAVLCSTVGPYSRYGTPVVEACVAAGTDYCDLTGEVHWMRRMIDRFDEAARRSGARIVHAAGFDSIPSDLGVLLAQERLSQLRGAPARSLRLRLLRQAGGVSRGTLDSMVGLVREAVREPWIRKLLKEPRSLEPAWSPDAGSATWERTGGLEGAPPAAGDAPPTDSAPPAAGGTPWRDPQTKRWIMPFFMEAVNSRVVHRSNALAGYRWGEAFSYREEILLQSGFRGFFGATAGRLLFNLAAPLIAFLPTRAILQATLFPKPGEGPQMALDGGGYFEGRIEIPETGEAVVTISADKDPGYGATAIMLGETAIALSKTREEFTGRRETGATVDGNGVGAVSGDGSSRRGGVLTPATALGAPLAEQLTEAGVRFRLEL